MAVRRDATAQEQAKREAEQRRRRSAERRRRLTTPINKQPGEYARVMGWL